MDKEELEELRALVVRFGKRRKSGEKFPALVMIDAIDDELANLPV